MTSLVQEKKRRNYYETVSKDAESGGIAVNSEAPDSGRSTVNNRHAYDSGGCRVALWQNQKTFRFNTKKPRSHEITTDELSLLAMELPAEVFPKIVHRIGVVKAFALE
jgi:hypothetical protein